MHSPPSLHVADYVAPVVAALLFALVMARVREPARLRVNAVLVAGAGGVYLSGGFGLWEVAFAAVAVVVAYRATRSYRFVAAGWLMHAGWDALHHLYGNPIWPFAPTSSFGCLVFDTLIALWLFSLGGRSRADARASAAG